MIIIFMRTCAPVACAYVCTTCFSVQRYYFFSTFASFVTNHYLFCDKI